MCIKSAQHTVAFHVNDLKSSHKDPKVNDDFEKWLEQTYGKQGKVKIKQGKFHEHLGMNFDFSVEGRLKVDMRDYVKEMLGSFPTTLGKMM